MVRPQGLWCRVKGCTSTPCATKATSCLSLPPKKQSRGGNCSRSSAHLFWPHMYAGPEGKLEPQGLTGTWLVTVQRLKPSRVPPLHFGQICWIPLVRSRDNLQASSVPLALVQCRVHKTDRYTFVQAEDNSARVLDFRFHCGA